MYIIFHTVLYIPKCTLSSILYCIFQSVHYLPYCTVYSKVYIIFHTVLYIPKCTLSSILYCIFQSVHYLPYCTVYSKVYIIFHTVLYIPKCALFSKLENKVHFGAVDIGVVVSVLVETTPLEAFARSGEFKGLENREPLLLDTRRGERTRVRRSLFGGGGAGTVESDSQSAIPRSKSGLDSTHYFTWVWSRVQISHSAAPRTILDSRPHPVPSYNIFRNALAR